jgi:hypothetical protein
MNTTTEQKAPRQGRATTAGGVVLIVLGGLLLLGQLAGQAFWPFGPWLTWGSAWPLLPIGVGLGLILLALTGGADATWLAVPGAVVTAVGLLLLVDHVTGLWQTWAYTWALVYPTAAGAGLWIEGQRCGRPETSARGRHLVESGLVLFAGFAAFFELVLNLSGIFDAGYARYLLPALLVAGGTHLLLRQGGRRTGALE